MVDVRNSSLNIIVQIIIAGDTPLRRLNTYLMQSAKLFSQHNAVFCQCYARVS